MRVLRSLSLIAAIAWAIPQLAAAADTKNEIGVFAGYLSPTGELKTNILVNDVDVPATIKLDSAAEFGLAYQYRFTDLFSLGASLLYSKLDVKLTSPEASGKIGDTTLMPLLLDGNFHVLKNMKTLDFYLGPTVGYAWWGDLKPQGIASDIGNTTSIKVKGKAVYGANFGLDVPFGSNWAFNAGVRYLWAKAEPDAVDTQSIDVNPWLVNVGVSYRF